MGYATYVNMAFGMGHSRNPALEEGIVQLLMAPLPFRHRWGLGHALSLLNTPTSAQSLIEIFRGPPEDKFTLLSALGEAPHAPGARGYLLQRLQDPQEQSFYRLMALVALGRGKIPVEAGVLQGLFRLDLEPYQQSVILEYIRRTRPEYRCKVLEDAPIRREDPVLKAKLEKILGECPRQSWVSVETQSRDTPQSK